MKLTRLIMTLLATLALLPQMISQAQQDRNLPLASPTTNDERRIALVIGNGAYAQGALANPVNDARAMSVYHGVLPAGFFLA